MDGTIENKTDNTSSKLYSLIAERDKLNKMIEKYETASKQVTEFRNATIIVERELKSTSPRYYCGSMVFIGEYEINLLLNTLKQILKHNEDKLKEIEQSF